MSCLFPNVFKVPEFLNRMHAEHKNVYTQMNKSAVSYCLQDNDDL